MSGAVSQAMRNPFLVNLAKQRDLIVVLGVVGVLVVMVIPMPTFLMDILLSMSICISLMYQAPES